MPVSSSYTLPAIVPATPSATSTEGEIATIADHCADGLSVLLEEYKQAQTLQNYICSFLTPVQTIENDLEDLLTKVLNISSAEGIQLDRIGEIVDYRRNGQTDDDYRRGLRARIAVNKSNGLAFEILEIAYLFTGIPKLFLGFLPFGYIRWIDYKTKPVVQIGTVYPDIQDLFPFLRDATAAGIGITLVYITGSGPTFSFSQSHGAVTTSSANGFSSAHSATGGRISGAMDTQV